MKNNYYIYKHTSPSGKIYIGQTCQKPEKRWKNGNGYIKNEYFTRAINKYGWSNFQHEILFENLTREEANQKEIELIAKYHSNDREFGYNFQSGGQNGSPSIETKEKMSKWQIGKILSEETKEKISKSRTGQKDSVETRIKKSNSQKGKQFSEETKLKLSESGKKRTDTAQRGKELGLANKGRIHSDESRKHMSESHKGINSKRVLCVETDIIYNSATEAYKLTGIYSQNISKVCNNKLKTAGGYHWKFII